MLVRTSEVLLPSHKSYGQHCLRQQTAYPVASAPLHSRVGSGHRAGAPPSRSTPPLPAPPGETPETRSQWMPPAVQRAATVFSWSQRPTGCKQAHALRTCWRLICSNHIATIAITHRGATQSDSRRTLFTTVRRRGFLSKMTCAMRAREQRKRSNGGKTDSGQMHCRSRLFSWSITTHALYQIVHSGPRTWPIVCLCGSSSSRRFRWAMWPTVSNDDGTSMPAGSRRCGVEGTGLTVHSVRHA